MRSLRGAGVAGVADVAEAAGGGAVGGVAEVLDQRVHAAVGGFGEGDHAVDLGAANGDLRLVGGLPTRGFGGIPVSEARLGHPVSGLIRRLSGRRRSCP